MNGYVRPKHPFEILQEGQFDWPNGWQPVKPSEDGPLSVFRNHHGLRGDDLVFASTQPEFDQSGESWLSPLSALLKRLGAGRCGLVYVHCGFHADYRSPVLPSILGALPDFSTVISHRYDGDRLPPEACYAAFALARGCGRSVLIWDRIHRLANWPQSTSAGKLHYTVLRLTRSANISRLNTRLRSPNNDNKPSGEISSSHVTAKSNN